MAIIMKKLFFISFLLTGLFCAAMQQDHKQFIQQIIAKGFFKEIFELPQNITFKGFGTFNSKEYLLRLQLWKSNPHSTKEIYTENLNILTGQYATDFDDEEDAYEDDNNDNVLITDYNNNIVCNQQKTLIAFSTPGSKEIYIFKKSSVFSKNITENCTFISNYTSRFDLKYIFHSAEACKISISAAIKPLKNLSLECSCGNATLFYFKNVPSESIPAIFNKYGVDFKDVPSEVQKHTYQNPTFVFLNTLNIYDDFQRRGLGTLLFQNIAGELQEKYGEITLFWIASPSNGTLKELCSFYTKKCGGTMLYCIDNSDKKYAYFMLNIKKHV